MEQINPEKILIKNPRQNANFLSILTFWWTLNLFKKGYSKVLEIGDLFSPVNDDLSERLGDRLER
jgi:ATP-binding cassette subfamily C (CFTR/MRP) protein 4